MKKGILALSILALTPAVTNAQLATSGGGGQFEILLTNILDFANSTLIPFIIGIGFLAFVFGMFLYFIAGGANDESREKGRKLMINATLGFVVIIIFFGIINLLTTSTGLEGESIKYIPEITVPN